VTRKAIDYSLADFYITDSPSMLQPPPDFLQWKKEGSWAFDLYEPIYGGPPAPHTSLIQNDRTKPMINLSSYGYLGLSRHPHVLASAQKAMEEYGVGMCGSPMLSGRNRLHVELEKRMCRLLNKESVLLFASGFGGALGSILGIARRGDVIIADSLIHMSLIDGAKLSGAKMVFFEHNDAASLDQVLSRENATRRLILLEGIYSMDGDFANLPALLDVAESHKVPVFIDEAHSIFGCGSNGGGAVEHFGASHRVALHFGCFSKACGALGGFLGASAETLDYLRLYAHTYTFSAGFPPVIAGAVLGALEVLEKEPQIRERLWSNADYLRKQLRGLGLDTGASASYVIPIVVGEDRTLLYEVCSLMRNRGLLIPPIDYPTVAQDQVRYRASVNAMHSRADLDLALNIIEDTLVPRMRAKGLLRSRES
jgi:glycine C-acetyltransferase